jgi:FKBP-type peptidyl-prolyl cis-trans isomerase FkpA/FKBP-type peptidyl-prolyl cis-trans isomerase FklB
MEDVITGKEPKMTPDEMRNAIMKMQQTMMESQKKEGEEKQTKGKAFLDQNKAKPGIKTTASGLQYIVEKEGTGATPKASDIVVVHYKGTLIDGTEFDSSYARNQPAEFQVSGVIKGWTEALLLFKVGTKAKLFIPPELAYGPMQQAKIPANSVLLFDVELLEIKKAEKK